MVNLQEISNMVSYAQVSYAEAECWYKNKERILELYPVLRPTDEECPEDDFGEWLCQQPVYFNELSDKQLYTLFQRYNSLCIARGGTGFKEVI